MIDLSTCNPEDLAKLSAKELDELEALVDADLRLYRQTKLYRLFPDTGPLRRELYPKHLAFYAAGATHLERALVGANRSGKSLGICYEVTLHLTGWYPHWWEGYRFEKPVTFWSAGEDGKSVRESLQVHYAGSMTEFGQGIIPGNLIEGRTMSSGHAEAIESLSIRHPKGFSRLLFKSYEQGRKSFQAAKIDGIQFDEEPPQPIYSEGSTRVMATEPGQENGLVMCGFTPLKGLSEVVQLYMPGGRPIDGVVG